MAGDLAIQTVIHLALSAPRVAIADAKPPKEPGAYLLHGRGLELIFGPEVGRGRRAAYSGSTKSLWERRADYLRRFNKSMVLRPENFTFTFAQTAPGMEGAVEKRLIQLLRPVLNGSGLGSNVPGSGRPGVNGHSLFDLICGDRLVEPLPADDFAEAVAKMLVLAKQSERATDIRWPALRRLPARTSSKRNKKAT